MLYDQFLAALDDEFHPFCGIYGHRPVNKKKGLWEVRVLWESGEISWEPLKSIWDSDRLTLAQYARDQGLTHLKGWRRTRYVQGDPAKVVRLATIFKAAVAQWQGPKFKFGTQVPRNAKEAHRLDAQNGDTKWKDAITKELS